MLEEWKCSREGKNMKKASLYALLVVSLPLLCSVGALACVCPSFSGETLEQETASRFRDAKAVFAGKVVKLEKVDGETSRLRTTIKVERWWKGELSEEIVLVGDGSSCDYYFTLGEKYLVFAYEREGRLKTGSCSRNVTLDKAAVQLRVLGKGVRPKKVERQPQGNMPRAHFVGSLECLPKQVIPATTRL